MNENKDYNKFVDILLSHKNNVYSFHISKMISVAQFKKLIQAEYKYPSKFQVLRKKLFGGIYHVLLDENYLYGYIRGNSYIADLFVYTKSDISIIIGSKKYNANIDEKFLNFQDDIISTFNIPKQYLRLVHPEKYMAMLWTDTIRMHCFEDENVIHIADMRTKTDTIKISILTETGIRIGLNTNYHCSVKNVKDLIQQKIGVNAAQQRIIIGSKELIHDSYLFDYGIQTGSVLHLILDDKKNEKYVMLNAPIRIPKNLAGDDFPVFKTYKNDYEGSEQKMYESPIHKFPCRLKIIQYWDRKRFRLKFNENIPYSKLIRVISKETNTNSDDITISINGEIFTEYESLNQYNNTVVTVEKCNVNGSQIIKNRLINITNKNCTNIILINLHFTIQQVKNEYVNIMAQQLNLSLTANNEENKKLKQTEALLYLSQLQKCHFLFHGQYMNDEHSLKHYGVEENSIIDAITNDSGGKLLQYMEWLKSYEADEQKFQTENKASSSSIFGFSFQTLFGTKKKPTTNTANIEFIDPKRFDHYLKNHRELNQSNLNRSLEYVNNHNIIKRCKELDKKYCSQIPDCALLSIYLWTTNLLYKSLNGALESHDFMNLKIWKPYLYYLSSTLRLLPYHYGKTVYRGIPGIKDISAFNKGRIVSFRRVTATSMSSTRALGFAMKKPAHVLLQIFSIDGRDISPISKFTTEKEVLFLPHSHFKVLDISIINPQQVVINNADQKNNPDDLKYEEKHERREMIDQAESNIKSVVVENNEQKSNEININVAQKGCVIVIKMKQIQTPRSGKVIVWVDDEPKNNMRFIYELEKQNISVIICVSTKEAELILNNYQWILRLKNGDIRIVTDMVRMENEKRIFDAGINLIKLLRMKYKYNHKVLIFCGDVVSAKKQCIESNIVENVYVTVSSKVLRSFVAFDENIDEKYSPI
eukprot:350120_1